MSHRSQQRQIRVLVVDDHPLMRDGIVSMINSESDMAVVAEAANGREAIDRFRSHRPDITLMDLQMANMDGVSAIEFDLSRASGRAHSRPRDL